MLPSLSVSELVSDLSADATAIVFDLPDGGYDRLHSFIESLGVLPAKRRDRIALIALLLVASRVLKQHTGRLGPLANFVNELGEDAVREEAKRILEAIRTGDPSAPSPRSAPPAPDRSVAGDAIRSVNEFFFPWMRMRREVSS